MVCERICVCLRVCVRRKKAVDLFYNLSKNFTVVKSDVCEFRGQ